MLAAGEYSSAQLAEYGLDPPRFVLAVAEGDGNTKRVGFGEATPAQNAQYVRIVGRPVLYLLPRDVGEEWQLARDMGERGGNLLLPVSIAQVWAIEIVSRGVLYRFERDPAGLWFHHVGQHVHTPGGFVHHADPKLAPLIAAELAVLDSLPVARIVARHPDAASLADAGLEHPATILLLYSRDSAGPVARIELGNIAEHGADRQPTPHRLDDMSVPFLRPLNFPRPPPPPPGPPPPPPPPPKKIPNRPAPNPPVHFYLGENFSLFLLYQKKTHLYP